MKKKRLQVGEYGELSFLNIITVSVLFVLNIINTIYQKYTLSDTSHVFIVLIVAIMVTVMLRRYKVYLLIAYVFMGICIILDPSNVSDFSPAIFFIFSFHILKNKFYGIGVLILSLILVTIKALVVNDTLPGIVIMIIAYAYIYTTYYFLIYKKHEQEKQDLTNNHIKEIEKLKSKTLRIDTLGLKEKEKAMIKMYVNGYSYDQISEFLGLNITSDTVRRNIWEIKKNSKTNNEAHFCKWLHDVV